MSYDTSGITEWLRLRLTDYEIRTFLDNEGIDEYSTITSSSIICIIDRNKFPEAHHIDYQWAIYEADIESIKTYRPEMRLLVSIIYCYCNRIRMLGTPVESRYYFMGIKAVSEIRCEDLLNCYLKFLKLIYGIGKKTDTPAEFFILLSIALILSMQAAEDGDHYQEVVGRLQSLSKKFNSELDLTVALDLSDWYSLDLELAGGQEQRDRLLAFLPLTGRLGDTRPA